MTPSPAHAAAVLAAIRLPALVARRDLLEAGSGDIAIDLHPDGEPGTPLASILQSAPTVLDESGLRVEFEADIQGLIVANGVATWARIRNRSGAHWADCTVSDADGDGDIKLVTTSLGIGAFVRLHSAVING